MKYILPIILALIVGAYVTFNKLSEPPLIIVILAWPFLLSLEYFFSSLQVGYIMSVILDDFWVDKIFSIILWIIFYSTIGALIDKLIKYLYSPSITESQEFHDADQQASYASSLKKKTLKPFLATFIVYILIIDSLFVFLGITQHRDCVPDFADIVIENMENYFNFHSLFLLYFIGIIIFMILLITGLIKLFFSSVNNNENNKARAKYLVKTSSINILIIMISFAILQLVIASIAEACKTIIYF